MAAAADAAGGNVDMHVWAYCCQPILLVCTCHPPLGTSPDTPLLYDAERCYEKVFKVPSRARSVQHAQYPECTPEGGC